MSNTNKKNQNKTNPLGGKQTANGPKKDQNVNKTTGANVIKTKEEPKEPANGPTNISLEPLQEEPKGEIKVTPMEPQDNVEGEKPKEDVKPIEDRKILAYHHKACADPKKATNTTLKSTEHLRSTDGKVTKDVDGTPTIFPVYSLKRGNRIYYVLDVTPQDIVKAETIAKEKLANATVTVQLVKS